MIQTIKSHLTAQPSLKAVLHAILVNKSTARPRWYTSVFLNPFVHKTRKGRIRPTARIDVFPFNKFEVQSNATIEDYCVVTNGVGDVLIGEGVRVGIGSVLMGPISIGKNTILGQHVLVTGLDHNYTDPLIPIKNQGVSKAQTILGEDSFIGANACILPGVQIGKHCVIAAGAVVTKSVPDFHIAAGNPARLIKKFDFNSQEWIRI